jgi:quercetin dioxygenase-like cupin family protein
VEARIWDWDEAESDSPIPLLFRRKVTGEKILLARINLTKGCVVAQHSHPNEQMSMILSGRVRWTIDGREVECGEGQILHLPAGCVHGLVTLEDTEVIDVLSPPGPMGVDSQGKS